MQRRFYASDRRDGASVCVFASGIDVLTCKQDARRYEQAGQLGHLLSCARDADKAFASRSDLRPWPTQQVANE